MTEKTMAERTAQPTLPFISGSYDPRFLTGGVYD